MIDDTPLDSECMFLRLLGHLSIRDKVICKNKKHERCKRQTPEMASTTLDFPKQTLVIDAIQTINSHTSTLLSYHGYTRKIKISLSPSRCHASELRRMVASGTFGLIPDSAKGIYKQK